MLVLALDTTTRLGSAALTRDGALLGAYTGDPAITHGVRLPGELLRLLTDHGVRIADVDLFAVAAGPGSFTGLRVGIATLQGLALANDRPLIGVSALDAVNDAIRSVGTPPLALSPDSEACIWMDGRRGQVFSALYSGQRLLEGPTVERPAEVLSRLSADALRRRPPDAFAGDGALEYATLIEQVFPGTNIVTDLPLLAPSIARLAEEIFREHGPSGPESIRPLYVRRSDAELARERLKI
jgi:tRNA threonylcarbamoyladenosine biosynthesis protein TsaB